MDGKMWAISALVILAMLLGGVVAGGLRQDRAAFAQGGVYATYLAVTAEVRDNNVDFIILDTASRRMIFYGYDQATKKLKISGGRSLGGRTGDFGRTD
ncbi:MAG: hypothetical protein WBD63_11160 [Phycisphaerae bacterium]|nr:hypothetical protein [Phycisphaerae bacterium]